MSHQPEKTEKKIKAVTEIAERSSSRLVGRILEERRGREQREAAAAKTRKQGALKKKAAVKPAPKKPEHETSQEPQVEDVRAGHSAPQPSKWRRVQQQHKQRVAIKRFFAQSHVPESSAACAGNGGQDLEEEKNAKETISATETWKRQNAANVFVPPSFRWHADEVKVSHKMLLNLTNADIQLLASFERPPRVVEMVLLAVHKLIGLPHGTWPNLRTLLRVEVRDKDQERGVRPHEQFQAALHECSADNAWRRAQEKATSYPQPNRPHSVAQIIRCALTYSPDAHDPREVLGILKPFTRDPEFTPENATRCCKAALALLVWVRAVELHYKEMKRKPRKAQLERAAQHGNKFLSPASNTRVWDWLPEIASNANKCMGCKTYHELVRSKNHHVRQIFHHPPPKLTADFHEVPDECERSGFVREVDLRASYQNFKSNIQERLSLSVKELAAQERQVLAALCKFEHPAFASEAAGRRSWDRFRDIDEEEVLFEDGAPRPLTAERHARKADDLDQMYKTNVLIRKMLRSIEANDQESVRKLVLAGADLEWTDEKGRSLFDIARDLKMLACLRVLESSQHRVHANGRAKKPAPTTLPKISLAVPPRTQHGKRRQPIRVVTYREHVAVVEDKYKLQDPNAEEFTESEEEDVLEEEEVDLAQKWEENAVNFKDEFFPPLTPPDALRKCQGSLENCTVCMQRRLKDERMKVPRPSSVTGTLREPPSKAIDRLSSSDRIERSPSYHVVRDPDSIAERTVKESQDKDTGPENDDDAQSSDTFLTVVTGLEEAAAETKVENAAAEVLKQSNGTGGTSIEFTLEEARREDKMLVQAAFDEKETTRTLSKINFFSTLQNGASKEGIDWAELDLTMPTGNEKRPQLRYLRKCEELRIRPRPLIFGQSDPEHINLKQFGLDGKQTQALAEALDGLGTCKSLNISGNRLGAEGVRAICRKLHDNPPLVRSRPSLTALDLSSCEIRENVAALESLLMLNKTLTSLSLQGNDIPDRALSKLLKVVRQEDILCTLNLARNVGGPIACPQILSLIANASICELDLSWMGLRLPFVRNLEDALVSSRHLRILNLSSNGLCNESADVFAQILLDCAYDYNRVELVLEHLDLGHNRIQKKGAICLALAAEKSHERIKEKSIETTSSLKTVVLNGNPIGAVGIRACLHANGRIETHFDVLECLPDSDSANFFEHGVVEKVYELDLDELHDRLVADRLVQIANTRFEGHQIIQSAVLDGNNVFEPPPVGESWFSWDREFLDDEGELEIVLDGPWKYFTCQFLGKVEGNGTFFVVDDVDHEITSCHKLAPPVSCLLLEKNVYFELGDEWESDLSRVQIYEKAVISCMFDHVYGDAPSVDTVENDPKGEGERKKVFVFTVNTQECPGWLRTGIDGVWDEVIEDSGGTGEKGEENLHGDSRKVFEFNVIEDERHGWLANGLPIRVANASGTLFKCVVEKDEVYLHIADLSVDEESILWRIELKEKIHHQMTVNHSILAVSRSFSEEQATALRENGGECKCWYVHPVPLPGMEDAVFEKTFKLLRQVLSRFGEERLLAFVKGIAKDFAMTEAQAGRIAGMLINSDFQRNAYSLLCGRNLSTEFPKRKLRSDKESSHPQDVESFRSALQRVAAYGSNANHSAQQQSGDEAFFDMFGGMMTLTRLDDDTSAHLSIELQVKERVEYEGALRQFENEKNVLEKLRVDAEKDGVIDEKEAMELDKEWHDVEVKEALLNKEFYEFEESCKSGVAFRVRDSDGTFPEYAFKSLRLAVKKGPTGEGRKTEFKVLDANRTERILLLQDQRPLTLNKWQAIDCSRSNERSLMQLTAEGASYDFEYPALRSVLADSGQDDQHPDNSRHKEVSHDAHWNWGNRDVHISQRDLHVEVGFEDVPSCDKTVEGDKVKT